MERIITINVEMLTDDAFRPFGEVLSIKARPADFRGSNTIGWKATFKSSAPVEVMVLSSRYAGFRFSKLERHLNVTQAFIPLCGIPAIVAVAEPTEAVIPSPSDIRAFLLDGTAGYILKKGMWHSLDRFPLDPPSAETVIITSSDTQHEIETVAPADWQLTRQVDYQDENGITFELKL